MHNCENCRFYDIDYEWDNDCEDEVEIEICIKGHELPCENECEDFKKYKRRKYKEEFTRCDTCENLKKCVADGKLMEVTTSNDKSRHFMKDIVFGCKKDLETLKKYGIELGGETKHSDSIRQTVKEVAEEMPALGKYDGDYAFPCGAFGYMDGLYRADFSCSNCGKRHEGVIYGTEIVCSCGKKIKTGS